MCPKPDGEYSKTRDNSLCFFEFASHRCLNFLDFFFHVQAVITLPYYASSFIQINKKKFNLVLLSILNLTQGVFYRLIIVLTVILEISMLPSV